MTHCRISSDCCGPVRCATIPWPAVEGGASNQLRCSFDALVYSLLGRMMLLKLLAAGYRFFTPSGMGGVVE